MLETSRKEFQSNFRISPCEVLCYELELREINQRELARRTGVTPEHVVDLLKGKSRITPETAIKLERAIGMPVDYWLSLEAQYQEPACAEARRDQLQHKGILKYSQCVNLKRYYKWHHES